MPKNPASTARKLPVIERSAFYTSPATGRTYWVDGNGLATEEQVIRKLRVRTGLELWPPREEQEPEYGCECEQDWNCGRHGSSRATWLETRYYDDDEEYR